ncbi:MAG: shikimate kinase, partial [Dorea sp.]
MCNMVLVGMPACGKSITGVVLAKTMRKNFVDTDLLIQEKEKRPLQD